MKIKVQDLVTGLQRLPQDAIIEIEEASLDVSIPEYPAGINIFRVAKPRERLDLLEQLAEDLRLKGKTWTVSY